MHKWKFLYACSLTCSEFARDFPFQVDKSYWTLLLFFPLCCFNPVGWMRKQCRSERAWCSCSCCPVAQDYSASLCISIRWFIPTSQSWLHRLSVPCSTCLDQCLFLHCRTVWLTLWVSFTPFNMLISHLSLWIIRSSMTLWLRLKGLMHQEMLLVVVVVQYAHR